MRIRDIMNKNIIYINSDSTLRNAMKLYANNEVDALLFRSENFHDIDIISKGDVFKALLDDYSMDSLVFPHKNKNYKKLIDSMEISEVDELAPLFLVYGEDSDRVLGVVKAKELLHMKDMELLSFKLESIIESSYDGIYITDGLANTIKINKAYERITGLNRNEMIGKNMSELVADKILSKSVTILVLQNKKVTTIHQEFRTGKKALVTGTPIYDKKGEIVMVVTNVRDITELAELKTQLEENRELTLKYYSTIEAMKLQLVTHEYIVAEDEKTLMLLELAQRIAKVDTTVIILGETGVGKEEVAKFIHKNSLRKEKPFIKINCGAIPANLVESELFGYEKGAFTGAAKEGKIGIFEVAEGGTLLLDEVGELPNEVQVKLLRALQEEEIKRVGGNEPIKIDVRILAATNRNLEQMIEEKTFREDLYYRLNVIPIRIPPLRERRMDILPLANLFIEQFNKKYNFNKFLSFSANACILHYDWPGNVRELKNIVERAMVTSKNNEITSDDLPEGICTPIKKRNDNKEDGIMLLKNAVEQVERELIDRAYHKHKNVRRAAQALGIDASTFVRKRQKFEK